MEEAIETIEYRNHFIKIYPDYDQEGPRQWDNLGILLTHHRDYDFNEGQYDKNIREVLTHEIDWYETKKEIEADIQNQYDPLIMAPVYLYDHSGLRLKIGSFQNEALPQGHAEFETSHIGYIIATKKQVREEWKVKRISKKLKRTVELNLEAEIDAMDKYVSGQVYGWSTFEPIEAGEDPDDLDLMDSLDAVWGYYDYDYMVKEAKSSIDAYIESQRLKKQNQVKTMIKNKVPLIIRQTKIA